MKLKIVHVTDITPKRFRCAYTVSCPAVFKTEEGDYYVVGSTLQPENAGLGGRVAADETAVKISGALLEEAIEAELKRREESE